MGTHRGFIGGKKQYLGAVHTEKKISVLRVETNFQVIVLCKSVLYGMMVDIGPKCFVRYHHTHVFGLEIKNRIF